MDIAQGENVSRNGRRCQFFGHKKYYITDTLWKLWENCATVSGGKISEMIPCLFIRFA